jgi:hypothetical protein
MEKKETFSLNDISKEDLLLAAAVEGFGLLIKGYPAERIIGDIVGLEDEFGRVSDKIRQVMVRLMENNMI